MKAEFSEFTYGFSLVSELAKSLSLTAVPIFPSLLEEGKKGGGYDAKLKDKAGITLNLQFKLSDWMKAKNAREVGIGGHNLTLPYYRFEITSERVSEQHSLLQSLEAIEPFTFYVAPAFHTNDEINAKWASSLVAKSSVFVKPSGIGDLPDLNPHRVCFDDALKLKGKAYFFSEPQDIELNEFDSFSENVVAAVNQAKAPVMERIRNIHDRYRDAILDARRRENQRVSRALEQDDRRALRTIETAEMQTRLDRRIARLERILSEGIDDDLEVLWQMAQVSSGIFGVQTFALVK